LPSAATTVATVAPLVLAALLHILLIVTGDIVRVGATVAAAVLAWAVAQEKDRRGPYQAPASPEDGADRVAAPQARVETAVAG
jgi:hypothetical protein